MAVRILRTAGVECPAPVHRSDGKAQQYAQGLRRRRPAPALRSGDEGRNKTVREFTRDLTADARAGRLDPVIGRDKEIQRVIQILSRRTKNNPCLIGEPGGGQDRHCRGAWPGRSCWARRARRAAGQAPFVPGPLRAWWPAPSTGASLRSGSRSCWRR